MTAIRINGSAPFLRAGVLLARADDAAWEELLVLLQELERQCVPSWQALAMTTLETLVASRASEALGRDPWSSVAPLITELLHGFARHVPGDVRRGVAAIEALFDQLAGMEPIIWPDGLPGAIVALSRAWAGVQTHLVAALARTLDTARLGELLACRRTTRSELRALRRISGDLRLVGVIDATLQAPRAITGRR